MWSVKNKNVYISLILFAYLFSTVSLATAYRYNNPKSNFSNLYNLIDNNIYAEKYIDSILNEVRYSDFGAKGDGKTDDIKAIVATHEYANKHGLKVKADDGATYYIGGKQLTVNIQTDTDFGSASFIIDDRNVQNRQSSIFEVSSKLSSIQLNGLQFLRKNQKKIKVSLPSDVLIIAINSNVKRYIRFGLNQNNGQSQTDIFRVDKNGNIDKNTPILWDFDQITSLVALPIDNQVLKISGGNFTTIANNDESKYNYYRRNININRSNVIIDGLQHNIIGEEDQGAPYSGFIFIKDCANVTIQNTILTGHKTYKTIGNAGKSVSMGTYDLQINRALNVLVYNCSQTNDINDTTYWGIMASNYSKNLTYDSCILSRFDAHMGVYNATIRNSTLGYAGINLIGFGTFVLENSKVFSNRLVNLRQDYGSTWQGNFIIRHTVFTPSQSKQNSEYHLFIGTNNGQHDFGYTCYMPKKITIENLLIDDSKLSKEANSNAIFNDFNPDFTPYFKERFPYIKTQKIVLKNVTTASGNTLKLSKNSHMFKKLKVIKT